MLFIALIGLSVAESPGALVLHDNYHFSATHSALLQTLKARFGFVKVSHANNAELTQTNSSQFSLIVFAASKANDCALLAEGIGLSDFFDNGGQLLFLGDNFASQGWRTTLGLFGFDVLLPSTPAPILNVQLDAHSRVFRVPCDDIRFSPLADGLNGGLLYEGQALRLAARQRGAAGIFLALPERCVLVEPNGAAHRIGGEEMGLGGFAQGTHVAARIAVLGSARLFSNDLIYLSNGDNLRFAENLLNWLQFRSMALRVRNFAFCTRPSPDCAPLSHYQMRMPFVARFQVFDANDKAIADARDFLFEFRLISVFGSVAPRIVDYNGESYFIAEFEGMPDIGVYRSKLTYARPGFHLDGSAAERELIIGVRPAKSAYTTADEILPLLPLIVLCLIVLISAAAIFWHSISFKD